MAKTKTLISFAVTAKLICVFVFAYAKIWFSHDAAHMRILILFVTSFFFMFKLSERLVYCFNMNIIFFYAFIDLHEYDLLKETKSA